MPKYKVKRGETLSQIAERMGIPESQLRQYNQGVQTVSTGQQISLPPSSMGMTRRDGGPSYANPNQLDANGNPTYIPTVRDANGNVISGPVPISQVGKHGVSYDAASQYDFGPQQSAWQSFISAFTHLPNSNEGTGTRNPNNRPVNVNNAIPIGTSPYTAKGQAGYYSTGPNERKVVTINGQQVRLGPNSTVTPAQQQQSPWWWPFQQQNNAGNLAGVRGAVPNSGPFKGAMPVQNKILGGQVYGGVSDPNAQQAFTPQPDRFSYAPNGYNSYTPYARNQPNPYQAPASNAHMQPIAPAPFMTQAQHLTGMSNPMYTGAPFMTSMQALNGIAKFNATPQPPKIKSNFGNYANGNARTGQEAFQQGSYRPSNRWWIRPNNKGGGAANTAAPVAPPELIQGLNWRV